MPCAANTIRKIGGLPSDLRLSSCRRKAGLACLIHNRKHSCWMATTFRKHHNLPAGQLDIHSLVFALNRNCFQISKWWKRLMMTLTHHDKKCWKLPARWFNTKLNQLQHYSCEFQIHPASARCQHPTEKRTKLLSLTVLCSTHPTLSNWDSSSSFQRLSSNCYLNLAACHDMMCPVGGSQMPQTTQAIVSLWNLHWTFPAACG